MKAIELYKKDNQIILISAITFFHLKDIVLFSRREDSNWSNQDQASDPSNQYYQRPTNMARVSGIISHIKQTLFYENNSVVLFPSSLILSMDLDDYQIEQDLVDFDIPTQKDSCLIVDGQHRLMAMKLLYEELMKDEVTNSTKIDKLSKYKFNTTILVNYDLWEQAQVFVSVNFNQKPVDRSLYYDIFGEPHKDNQNEKLSNLYIAHELGKFLNSSNKSPIQGFVKNFNNKKGFISQAFLTEAILGLLGPRSNWNYIVEDYKNNGDKHKNLPKIFVGYFSAIKNVFPEYWPKSNNKEDATILSKTNGLGALIKLLGWSDRMLKLKMFPNEETIDLLELNSNEIINLYEKIFYKLKILNEHQESEADKLFGKNSPYSGGGSVGLQNQLFKDLAKAIGIEYDRSKSFLKK